MNYKISGMNAGQFIHLFGQSDSYLQRYGAIRHSVEDYPSCPDRISLRDIPAGENAILINHLYQPADTPYRGSHAIYIWEGCTEQGVYFNEVPEVMQNRLLSLRAFDDNHFLRRADVCQGHSCEAVIEDMFADPQVSYIHIHNAKQGCYACLAERDQ